MWEYRIEKDHPSEDLFSLLVRKPKDARWAVLASYSTHEEAQLELLQLLMASQKAYH